MYEHSRPLELQSGVFPSPEKTHVRGTRFPPHDSFDGDFMRRRIYIPVWLKMVIAAIGAILWLSFSIWIARFWAADISTELGIAAIWAWIIVALIALIPGFIVALLAIALLLDKQPPLGEINGPLPDITILIAAFNEESRIIDTLNSIARSRYDGAVHVIVVDNNSTDHTAELVANYQYSGEMDPRLALDFSVISELSQGKFNALNTGLTHVQSSYFLTLDADTLVHPQALSRILARAIAAPKDTVAVAGSVLVRNSRVNLLTRMQEWDYYLGIAAVKRMQGLFQSTLVAQGAFSLYSTKRVREVGGWSDAIGEDIVLTWSMMADSSRVFYEPTAVAFTEVPTRLQHYFRQRSRWARGMFEGLRAIPPWRQKRWLSKFVASINLLIPLLDFGYVFIWLPGLLLFVVFQNPLFVSAWTLLVLPGTLLVYGGMRRYQVRRMWCFTT